MKTIEIAFCLVLGVIFLLSAVPKLRAPKGFVFAVLEYRVLPLAIGRSFGWILPPLEFFLAVLFLTGTLVSVAALLTMLLLLSFIGAVTLNIGRGRELDCHCLSRKFQHRIGWPLILQDLVLLGGAMVVAFVAPAQASVEPWSLFHFVQAGQVDGFLALFMSLVLTGGAVWLLRLAPPGKRRME